ncbi:hypothetical protein CP360_06930 [Lactobacillus sp. UMNPBX9]|nr:hypothetical protein CP360_06930 [Lactobacillus sp. UMNPBX9]
MIIIKTHIYENQELIESKTKIIDKLDLDGTIWLHISKDNTGYDNVYIDPDEISGIESQYYRFRFYYDYSEQKLDGLNIIGVLRQIESVNITSDVGVKKLKEDADKLFEAVEMVKGKLKEIVGEEVSKGKNAG